MKYLVLGCNGMAGHTISLYLAENGHDVTGFARYQSSLVDSIIGDVKDTMFLRKTVIEGRYDVVINCIGILNQFAENNKADAVYLNAYLPHLLVDMTRDTSTRVFHMSTDCVFSGDTGGYSESSLRDGRTFYDRSKALGEIEDKKNITFRNSIIGPDLTPHGIGLVNWFMQQKGTINGYVKVMWTGQTTLQLAKTMEIAATSPSYGLINAVPSYAISKYDLLIMMNKYLRDDEIEILPLETIVSDKSLVRTNFDLAYTIPDYPIMISEMSEWIKRHKHLYPHYYS